MVIFMNSSIPQINCSMRLSVREIALSAMLGALTFGLKVALAPLPNIEVSSLMVMLFAVTFELKAVYPIYAYVLLEILVYGVNLWSINYLYVWFILAITTWIFRKMTSPWEWAVLSGSFGLLFGLLCAPVYFFVGGWAYAVSWWISGIPFDILHCIGNFVVALVLFTPLRQLLDKLLSKDAI